MIQCTCANCGLQILVPETVQGRPGTCFGCGEKLQVPQAQGQLPSANLQYSEGDRAADRYLLKEVIGDGGMGVVFRARDDLIDEDVALKFMNPRALKTQKGQKLFIKEAQIARHLRHENIVAVHDVSTTPEGVLYLSMELLEGRPLRQYLNQHRLKLQRVVSGSIEPQGNLLLLFPRAANSHCFSVGRYLPAHAA